MKKLMLAVAAVAAGVAMADGITSANVVGYASKDLATGFGKQNVIGGMFKAVGKDGSAMTIGDLKPNEAFEFANDKVWIFNSDGNFEYRLYYATQQDLIDNDVLKDFPNAEPGWYTTKQVDTDWDFSTNMNDVSLPQGAGFLVTSKNAGAAIVSSGEVNGEDIPLDLATGAGKQNVLSFCSPISGKTWSWIKPNTKFEFANDKIWIFDDQGNFKYRIYYATQQDLVDNEILKDFPNAEPGWYTTKQVDTDWDFSTNMNDLPLEPGQGFLVTSKNDGAQIIIPAAY